jgi:hypothetical protein
MPDGIELFGEIERGIPVNEAVDHPTALAFTFRDAELRPQLQGTGLVRGSNKRVKGKAYAIPVVPDGWDATTPVSVWLVTTRDFKDDTLHLWPSQLAGVIRADFDGGSSAHRDAVANAIEKYHLPVADRATMVRTYDDPEGLQARAWTTFYDLLKVDAGIWLVVCFITWVVVWLKVRQLQKNPEAKRDRRRYAVPPGTIAAYIVLFLTALGILAGGYAAYANEVFLLPWFLFGFGTLMIFAGMAGLRNSIRNLRIQKEEDEAKARLQGAKAEGYEMAYERDEQLSPQDHKDLDRLLWKSVWIILIPTVVFSVASYWLVYFGILVLPCFILLALSFRNVQRIRRENVKTVVRGFVTNRLAVRSRRIHNRSVTPDFYIQIGERKFLVDAAMYEKFKAGDMVEIHFINRPPRKMFGVNTNHYVIISARTVPYVGVS